MPTLLWLDPHHDGSGTLVSDPHPSIGGTTSAFLRVPRGSETEKAWVRLIVDGEPELVEAVVDREDERATWLRADLRVVNPVLSYRWLLDGGPHDYRWLNGPESSDRFAKSRERPVPAWALPASWDDPVIGEGPDTPRQLHGGDLDGITAHLDHIASLGVGTIYLTRSSRRSPTTGTTPPPSRGSIPSSAETPPWPASPLRRTTAG